MSSFPCLGRSYSIRLNFVTKIKNFNYICIVNGLGDIIASLIPIKPCKGCIERKKKLNEMFPLKQGITKNIRISHRRPRKNNTNQ